MTTYHGTEALFAVKTDNTVAYTDAAQIQTFSLDQASELLEIYELGGRAPVDLKEAKITITGDIKRHFETGNFSAAGATLQELVENATEVWCAIFPEGDAAPKILASNCKFFGWKIEGGIDGMVIETAKYKGRAISIT